MSGVLERATKAYNKDNSIGMDSHVAHQLDRAMAGVSSSAIETKPLGGGEHDGKS